MARTTGPLMSLDASGTLANTLTFSKWKGRSYVRERVIPSNPRSPMQTAMRAMMAFLGAQWAGLTTNEQATWDTQAAARSISPFNSFVANNQRRWANFETPTAQYPVAGIGTPAVLAAPAGVGGVRQATVTQVTTTENDHWGTVLFRKLGSAPTGDISEAIQVKPTAATGDTTTFVDSPLEPGTYHYKTNGFTVDGVWGTLSADCNAVVT